MYIFISGAFYEPLKFHERRLEIAAGLPLQLLHEEHLEGNASVALKKLQRRPGRPVIACGGRHMKYGGNFVGAQVQVNSIAADIQERTRFAEAAEGAFDFRHAGTVARDEIYHAELFDSLD